MTDPRWFDLTDNLKCSDWFLTVNDGVKVIYAFCDFKIQRNLKAQQLNYLLTSCVLINSATSFSP